jgi:hypothetical protein
MNPHLTAADLDLIRDDNFQDRWGRWHTVLSVTDVRPGRVAIFCTDGLLLHEDTAWVASLSESEQAA